MKNKGHHSAIENARLLEDYFSGKLTEKERHAFEKASLSDPFEAEALEGWEESQLAPKASAIVAALQGQLQQGHNTPKPTFWLSASVQKVAAAILLFGSIGAIWWSVENRQSATDLAFQPAKTFEEPTLQKERATQPLAQANQVEPESPVSAATALTVDETTASATAAPTNANPSAPEKNSQKSRQQPQAISITKGTMTARSSETEQKDELSGVIVTGQGVAGTTAFGTAISLADSATTLGVENTALADITEAEYAAMTEATDTVIKFEAQKDEAISDQMATSKVPDSALTQKSKKAPAERENTLFSSADGMRPKEGWLRFQQYIDQHRKTFPEHLEKLLPSGITLNFRTQNGRPVMIDSDSWGNPTFEKEAIRLLQEGPDWEPANTIEQTMILIELRPRQ